MNTKDTTFEEYTTDFSSKNKAKIQAFLIFDKIMFYEETLNTFLTLSRVNIKPEIVTKIMANVADTFWVMFWIHWGFQGLFIF